MNERNARHDAEEVLDFSDIVLITMSSAGQPGRVRAASICSCGTIVAPGVPQRADHAAAHDACATSNASAPRLRARFGRFVAAALRSLRAS